MRNILALVLCSACLIAPAFAGENRKSLTDAERAKVKAQVEALKKNKTDGAAKATQILKDSAHKQGQAIDQVVQGKQKRIDAAVEGLPWLAGEGQYRKDALNAQAQAQKDKIAADGKKKAAAHAAAAQKQAKNVAESIEGLKTQVGKDGKYGLQPGGSSLYVRQYGTGK